MSVDHHDLDQLTGIRSGKPSFYIEYLASAERLRRVIHALDRISRALVRTTEGPGTLVRAVAEAAADHLTAHWVVFAANASHKSARRDALNNGKLVGEPDSMICHEVSARRYEE